MRFRVIVKAMLRKIIVTCCIFLSAVGLYSQNNLTDMDYKIFKLGFLLGTNLMDMQVNHSEINQDGRIYFADVSELTPGFTIGLITDLRLHRYFNLRFTPSLHLGNRKLSFNSYDPLTAVMTPDKIINIFSLPVDLPVLLRYSAERWGNLKPYIQVGVGTYFDLGRDEIKDVTLNLSDIYFSVGGGCELYFKYFRLSPELRINLGQTNVLTPKIKTDDNAVNVKYTNAINSLFSRIIVLSFNIE